MPLSQRYCHIKGKGAPTLAGVFPGTARLSVWSPGSFSALPVVLYPRLSTGSRLRNAGVACRLTSRSPPTLSADPLGVLRTEPQPLHQTPSWWPSGYGAS